MNRLTIFLLAGVTVLLSGVAERRWFDAAVAPASVPAAITLPEPAPLVAPATSNDKVVQRKAADKSRLTSPAPADKGEVRRAATARVEPRAVTTTTTSIKSVVTPRKATSAAAPAARNYERDVAEAETLGAGDPNRAARRLEVIAWQEPARPEAYEKLAAIRLQLGDYYQAYEMYASAVRNGGKASFAVLHDHARGNFDSKAHDTCAGTLSILPDRLTFDSAEHNFAVSWAELLEAGSNRLLGSGIGGFHVKVGAEKGSRNFNLAPRSRDKREANIILDLLIDNAESR